MGDFFLSSGGSVILGDPTTCSGFLAVESAQIQGITGVGDEDLPVIEQLLKVWRDKYPRNLIRSRYVDAHYSFNDFGISIPGRIKSRVRPMIGWPAKAVSSLADLSVFQGFSFPDGDDLGISDMLEDNAFDADLPQAISSAYTHSCAFVTVARDPDSPGSDARMLLMPRSADWSAAIWDRANRRIMAALTITEDDSKGRITEFNAWLTSKIYHCRLGPGGWTAERYDTNLDRPSIVPLCFDPQLNRPFGRSRVSRQLMALTDIAFRTVVRMEASAEFYAVPKLWFLGADEDAFSADTWSSLISAINSISKDEDGDKPDLRQITQASMQPHSDMLKTIALLVASETDIPVHDLGVSTDNPPSAESLAASERKLSRRADRQNRLFGRAIKDAVSMAVRMRDGLSETPESVRSARPVWAPTREVSDAARADSFSKIAAVSPEFAQSEVGWRYAGFDQQDVESIMSTIRRSEASSTLDKLIAGGGNDDQGAGGSAVQGAAAGGSDGAPGAGVAGGVTGGAAAADAA